MDKILTLQGVNWMTRKIIAMATITFYIRHYKDNDGVEHIDTEEFYTGGVPGIKEKKTLWWREQEYHDYLVGDVKGKSRRAKIDVLDDSFLREGWTGETLEHGVIQSYSESDTSKSGKTWTDNQVD